MTEEILTHRAVQAWTLITRQTFGGDRTMYSGVMTTLSHFAIDILRCQSKIPPEYLHFHHSLTFCKFWKEFEHVRALKKPINLPE